MGNKRTIKCDEELNLNRADLPIASLFGSPHIELFGNHKMSLEGKYSILEYSEEDMKIKLSKQIVSVFGSGIMLSSLECGSFTITGKFSRIEFE